MQATETAGWHIADVVCIQTPGRKQARMGNSEIQVEYGLHWKIVCALISLRERAWGAPGPRQTGPFPSFGQPSSFWLDP